MNSETKQCQNCKQNFVIEPDDFQFYEKIQVPPPTLCFDCRVQRRMSFRNERVLYKRQCQAPGHDEQVISIFSPDNPQTVYCHKSWWGDSWDPLSYGKEIDWQKPFLAQLKDLWREVPDISVLNINPVNSDYCSITEGNKNCYLVFGGDFNENTLYSTYIFHSQECMDTYWVQKSEWNYETVDCISCTKLSYGRYCEGCYDSYFLFNCRNCHDCLGCVNLVNAAYQIFNEQYSREEYEKKIRELNLGSRASLAKLKEKFAEHMLKYPRRFAKMLHTLNSVGDNLENCRNCRNCFDIFEGGENCTDIFLSYSKVSDSRDVDRVGLGAELGYDSSTIYPGSRVFFSRFIFGGQDIRYSYNIHNSSHLFGCVGLRNQNYCILNKQYSPEEYAALVPKILEHMNKLPYVDKNGRSNYYGEFFPADLSPFGYNETLAAEMFPLLKDQVVSRGFRWQDPAERNYQPTKQTSDLPDDIKEVGESICSEIIACEHGAKCTDQCPGAFRIVPAELAFYKRMNLPLPTLCPNCRHFARIRQRNPMKLCHRQCQCNRSLSPLKGEVGGVYQNATKHSHGDAPCPNEFETTYSLGGKEIVYCEQCYQAEVA